MPTRILVVEDDPTQAAVLASMLGARGYFVQVAVDGREALRWLKVGLFDAAVVDYRIPEIDGLAVARVTHDIVAPGRSPVLIALTGAHNTLRDKLAGRHFDAVFAKPVAIDALTARISELVAARGQHPTTEFAAADAANDEMAAEEIGAGERVLVVDDDIETGRFLALSLAARGYRTEHATSGFQAVERCRGTAYDAILMDYQMPEMNGLVAAELIADHGLGQARPSLLALTANPRTLISLEFNEVTVFDAIVDKAHGLSSLLDTLERCLSYRRLRRASPAIDLVDLEMLERIAGQRGDDSLDPGP